MVFSIRDSRIHSKNGLSLQKIFLIIVEASHALHTVLNLVHAQAETLRTAACLITDPAEAPRLLVVFPGTFLPSH